MMKDKIQNIVKRVKDFLKNEKAVAIAIVFAWILLVAVTLFLYRASLGQYSIGNDYGEAVVELNSGNTIVQELDVETDSSGFAIELATYARNNSGNTTIEIVGKDSNHVYAKKTINNSLIQDNAFYSISFDQALKRENDQKVTVKLSSNSKEGKALGIYYATDIKDLDTNIEIGNSKTKGLLTYRFFTKNASLQRFTIMFISISIIAISFFLYLILFKKLKLHILYTSLAFAFGLIFMFVITPFSPPDEVLHYEESLQFSNVLLGKEIDADVDEVYMNVSEKWVYQVNNKYSYIDLVENISKPLELTGITCWFDVDARETYSTYYIPQSIGTAIGRALTLNELATFYLGRLTNLLFYCACVFIAVKNTPTLKVMFGGIAILPIFIQQAASHSYDCFINGLCLISAAYFLKWMLEDNKIQITDYIIVFLCCHGLAPAKFIYGLFALLYWAVPSNRFKNKGYKIVLTCLLCYPMAQTLYPIFYSKINQLIVFIKRSLFSSGFELNAGTNTISLGNIPILFEKGEEKELITMGYLMRHPKEIFVLIMFTIRYSIKSWFYGAMGRYLSALNLILPLTLSRITVIIILLSALLNENLCLNRYSKLFVIIICVGVALFSIGGMMFSWTYVGDTMIQGLQGRYYCPLLAYFYATFNNKKIKIPTYFGKYITVAQIMMMFEVIIYIISFTCVN